MDGIRLITEMRQDVATTCHAERTNADGDAGQERVNEGSGPCAG